MLKPKASAIDVKEQDSKGKAELGGGGWTVGEKQKLAPKSKISEIGVRRQEGKGKAGSAASKIAAGNQKPSPAPKLKNPEVEVEKQAGKGKADSASAGKIAAGSQNPSPLPKRKTSRDRSQEAGQQRQRPFRHRQGVGGQQTYAGATAEIEDPCERSQETKQQRQSRD